MAELRLRLRTPEALVVDREVKAITAEDQDGWFGVAPGRSDLVAALRPGLLVFRDDEGEGFVALSGGLLDLRRGECRVMAPEAVLSRRLEDVSRLVADHVAGRRSRSTAQRDVLHDLAREALRRLVREARS